MDPDFFPISSADLVPRHYLHGFCIQEEDFIIGNEGYARSCAAQNIHIQPGQDGSYIIIRTAGDETVIGTDCSGSHKLFLYQLGEKWALSNSFIELVRFAAKKYLPVTVDESHLASVFINGPFGDPLTCLRTSIREIRLVPSIMEAVIIQTFYGTAVKLRPLSSASKPVENKSYEERLRGYLRLWVGRMATVLQSDLHMRADLTGGRDSRAVLSLMLAAAKYLGNDLMQRVNFASNRDAKADFAVASQIAEKCRLHFMDRSVDPRAPVRLNSAEATRNGSLSA